MIHPALQWKLWLLPDALYKSKPVIKASVIYIQKQCGILIVPIAPHVDFLWREYEWLLCLMDCDKPSKSHNMATRFQSQTVLLHSSSYFFCSLPLTQPHSFPWPWNPLSCPLIELGSPWTMVITLPEAITIKQRWSESKAQSALQRQEAVYTEPREEPGDTHNRSSQRCFPQAGRKRLGSAGVEGLGGTDLFLQDPSCQDLPTQYEMLGNVTLQTDVPQPYMENWRSGYTHCIQTDKEWRQDAERRIEKWWALEVKRKPGLVTFTAICYLKNWDFLFFCPMVRTFQKLSEKHQSR